MGNGCSHCRQCTRCYHVTHIPGVVLMPILNGKYGLVCRCGERAWQHVNPRTCVKLDPAVCHAGVLDHSQCTKALCRPLPLFECTNDVECLECKAKIHIRGTLIMSLLNSPFGRTCPQCLKNQGWKQVPVGLCVETDEDCRDWLLAEIACKQIPVPIPKGVLWIISDYCGFPPAEKQQEREEEEEENLSQKSPASPYVGLLFGMTGTPNYV